MAEYASVEDYVASFPEDVRRFSNSSGSGSPGRCRSAGEKISYQMPTITAGGKPVVHFAGWKSHVSLYPEPEGDEDLHAELAPYVAGKGTLKFPLNQPIPYELIERVASRLYEERSSPKLGSQT